jgi:hypothetical protein
VWQIHVQSQAHWDQDANWYPNLQNYCPQSNWQKPAIVVSQDWHDSLFLCNPILAPDTHLNPFAIDWARHVAGMIATVQAHKANPM